MTNLKEHSTPNQGLSELSTSTRGPTAASSDHHAFDAALVNDGRRSDPKLSIGTEPQLRKGRIPHTDLLVSRIAYGVGMLGLDWHCGDLISRSVLGIRAAHERGINFFDTADVYAEGQSEIALNRAFAQSPTLRNELVIQTKCGIRLGEGWVPSEPIGPASLRVDLSYQHIVSAAERSLVRLGTEWLDVLLLHSPSPLIEPDEVARAFDYLKTSGKVRYFGVCSHSAMQIELLRKFIQQPLVVNQIWLGLMHHSPISDSSAFGSLVEYCRVHEIQVQAYSPLKGGSIFSEPVLFGPRAHTSVDMAELARTVEAIAQRHEVSPAAIQLAWLLHHPAGIVPIIGATSVSHIVEDCAADRVRLTSAEWQLMLECAKRYSQAWSSRHNS